MAEEDWPQRGGLVMTLEKWPERGGKEEAPAYQGVGTYPWSCSLWAGPCHVPRTAPSETRPLSRSRSWVPALDTSGCW